MMISKITDTQQGHYDAKKAAPSPVANSSDVKVHKTSERATGAHADKRPSHQLSVGNDRATINRLDSQNAQRNQYARKIRMFDQTMEKVSTQIKNMKKELRVIVKNYPPFPPGSEERIARLSRFNSFRKQIEQLTIPPTREGNHTATGSPASPHVGIKQGSLVIEAAEDDGYILSVRRTNTKADRVEVNLPELYEDASDALVQTTLKELEISGATIQAQRQTVRLDVHKVNISQENSEFFNISENKAEAKSHVMRNDLAKIPNAGLTREPAQLVGFLN